MHVLLIEDDPDLVTFYSRALMRAGFVVTAQRTGDDGLRMALSNSFSAIVVDWFLPGMDGLTVVREIRGRGVDTPILMLSGSGELVREQAIAGGANGFLSKPCGLQELSERVMVLATAKMVENLSADAA
jgi:two-component system OmpR family response regulator